MTRVMLSALAVAGLLVGLALWAAYSSMVPRMEAWWTMGGVALSFGLGAILGTLLGTAAKAALIDEAKEIVRKALDARRNEATAHNRRRIVPLIGRAEKDIMGGLGKLNARRLDLSAAKKLLRR